jgi:hypothetical protein
MVSVQTHEETVRRLTEQAGSWMEAAQIAEVEAGDEPEPEDEQPLQRCVFSADGAMISLVNKQWVKTRTVAIGPTGCATRFIAEQEEGRPGHLSCHSCFAFREHHAGEQTLSLLRFLLDRISLSVLSFDGNLVNV